MTMMPPSIEEIRRKEEIKAAAVRQGQTYAIAQADIANARRLGTWSKYDGLRIATEGEALMYPFPCKYCSRRFGEPDERNAHSRNMHGAQ